MTAVAAGNAAKTPTGPAKAVRITGEKL